MICSITIFSKFQPRSGSFHEFGSLDAALDFILDYRETYISSVGMYEVEVFFKNENRIKGSFREKNSVIDFLNNFKREK